MMPEGQDTPVDIHPFIPRVLCPRCGTTMRLSHIEPHHEGRETTTFDCRCGFTYRQTATKRGNGRVA